MRFIEAPFDLAQLEQLQLVANVTAAVASDVGLKLGAIREAIGVAEEDWIG
jgi:hypothetical protein